jgi:chaperonin GroES
MLPLPPQVVALGDEVDLDVKAGDMVVYQKYAMAEVEVPEGEVLFVAQKSIMAVLQQ